MQAKAVLKSFAVVAALAASFVCIGQTYPAKPVKLIVPWSAGGGADQMARMIGQKLGAEWTEQIVIENRPGASGNIGAEAVARAAPDGYTIMLTSDTIVTASSLYKSLSFDPLKDFAPITLAASFPYVLVVNSNLPIASVKELISLAKSKPRQLNYASAGAGSPFHLAAELFKNYAQVEITGIPYKGGGPALVDLIGGRVDLAFANLVNVMPHIKAGRLRGLAITTAKRSLAAAELPTIAESGLPGYDFAANFGLFAPAGVPKDVISKLYSDIASVLKSPEIRDRLSSGGAEVIAISPDEYSAYLQAETQKWTKVIKAAGITIE